MVVAGFAQSQSSKKVLLKSGEKLLPQSTPDDFLRFEQSELVAGKYYRFIQFNQLPDASQKRELLAKGIELLDYIPHQTYIAALPANLDFGIFHQLDIRSITPIQIADKLDRSVNNSIFGNQTTNLEVILQYQKNIAEEFVREFLNQNHIEIISSNPGNHTFRIFLNTSILERIAAHPIVAYIEKPPESAIPEDINGRSLHRSNMIATQFNSGRHYDGSGVHVAIGDYGMIGPHIDFTGRIFQNETTDDAEGAHDDMVAGILAGADNLDPDKQGMAKGALLHLFNGFEAIENATSLYDSENIVITSTSFGDGCNRGYTTFTQLADKQINEIPALMHVFSAGNAGDQDCGYGAGAGWGNITGGVKVGKNVIAVGNLYANDELVFNSSRGPTNDGRIKPDICANGDGQYSTAPNNEFQIASGSSAAAPGVAGVLAQLFQAYQELHNGEYPGSALLKASLLNTAEDLGNKGPDFSFGWGRVNAYRSLLTLEEERYFEGAIDQNENHQYFIDVPANVRALKVMLYWNDYQGSTVTSKSLVNDLDLQIFDGNVQHLPWVLNTTPDAASLSQPATKGMDHINNVEQVLIENPTVGIYEIVIDGFEIPFGPQKYTIVYEMETDYLTLVYPFGGEHWQPETTERIYWDASDDAGDFQLEYSTDGGNSWNLISTVPNNQYFYDWTIPNVLSGQFFIRVSRNDISDVNDASINVIKTPTVLTIAQVCPDYIRLEWEPVDNAVSYIVYQLGDKYMDSIATTFNTEIDVLISNPHDEHWFSVSSIGPQNEISKRAIAISDGHDLINCIVENDLSLLNIASPNSSSLQSCFDNPIPVSVNIRNEGAVLQSGFSIFYQFDDEAIVEEQYSGSIPPSITVNYNFQTDILPVTTGLHKLKVWISLDIDGALYNDTLQFQFSVVSGSTFSIPYFENFDDFENCDIYTQCGSECSLSNGWINNTNNFGDDLDWLVNNGTTTTYATGPETDQNTNNTAGKYLYIEGSPACHDQQASLISPCLDLSATIQPEFSFWYHMFGTDMGKLHVDIFDGITWYNNIIVPISGDHGDLWHKITVDISSFAGQLINIRFRGFSGTGYLSDLAIDNIALLDAATPPVSEFTAGKQNTCSGQAIQFYDNSFNSPQVWTWEISPPTISFIDGTTANSQNPIVLFNEIGEYTVSLTTSNEAGDHETTKVDFIKINNGIDLPFKEDFENIPIGSEQWTIENPDRDKTWEYSSVIGKSGDSTTAIYVNNHSYNAPGQQDRLAFIVIDLTTAQSPYLRFDLSYARFNQSYSDGLKVELSSDCQENFDHIVYQKSGNTLATAPNSMTGWKPTLPQHWRTEIIDLSEYIGDKITLRFVNICGFGNNLYIDNIIVYEYNTYPQASFSVFPDEKTVCKGESLIFTNTSFGEGIDNHFWTFGENSLPVSADSPGPHTVFFNETGNYEISLLASNSLGWDKSVTSIDVIDIPVSDFIYDINDGVVAFTNNSLFGNEYFWDFGDGATSTDENPSHNFGSNNIFSVQLRVSNKCGEHSILKNVSITTNTIEPEKPFQITITPNPADRFVDIEWQNGQSQGAQILVFDVSGKKVKEFQFSNIVEKTRKRLNVAELSYGMYFIKMQSKDKTAIGKLVIF
jgi:PKD repeat protein/subtilisin family serine protease